MKKINLTEILLVVLLIISLVFAGKQLYKAKAANKKYKELLTSYTSSNHDLNYLQVKEELLIDSIIYLKQLIETNNQNILKTNAKISDLKAHISILGDSLTKLSPDSNYVLINSMIAKTDSLQYIISGNQVNGISVSLVEGEFYMEMIKGLESNILLEQSNKKALEELYGDCGQKIKVVYNDNQRLRKKMWFMRGGIGVETLIITAFIVL